MLPFTEKIKENESIRTFKSHIDEDLLLWHRDREDRIVESISNTNWMIQIDNELPKIIEDKIFIPKGIYHRVIRGNGDLIIKVIKL